MRLMQDRSPRGKWSGVEWTAPHQRTDPVARRRSALGRTPSEIEFVDHLSSIIRVDPAAEAEMACEIRHLDVVG